MSDRPDPEFKVGDRVVCTGDSIDDSWEGEEGTIEGVDWNDGGTFAGPRWIYRIRWDIDGAARNDDDLDTSDDFEIEAA